MEPSRSEYCRVCKIGTLDAEGLCVLCGAPSVPLPLPRRAVGEALAALTSLPSLATYAVLLLAGGIVAAWSYFGPERAPAVFRQALPGGGLAGGAIALMLIAPVVLALLVMFVLFLMSRRSVRPSKIQNAAETY